MNDIPDLSPHSRKIMMNAKVLARDHHHEFLTTEHILLSILESDNRTKGVETMSKLKIDLKEFSSFVIDNLRKYKGDKRPELKDVEPSPRVLNMLSYAASIAKEMSSDTVRVDHMLLSILVSDAGSGNNLFRLKNIDVDYLYEAIYVVVQPKRRKKLKQSNNPRETTADHAQEDVNDTEETPLDKYAENLTMLAANGGLDPVIGRDEETEDMIRVLSRRTKNNPVLIGEPGVGKTAIVELLAQRVVMQNVPHGLQNKQIYSLDLAQLVAGTIYRGQFEERMKEILNHVQSRNDVILFIDEMHMIVGAGSTTGSMDVSNILKPALARGGMSCIGATTLQEYKEFIEPDGALERRFQTVMVEEPSTEDTLTILKGVKQPYEQYHNVKYNNKTLEHVVFCCDRYMTDKRFPDKAIDVLDELGANAKVNRFKSTKDLTVLIADIQQTVTDKELAVETQQFDLALGYRETEYELIEQLQSAIDEQTNQQTNQKPVRINCEHVKELVSIKTGIPVSSIGDDEAAKILDLNDRVNRLVVGQTTGVNKICDAIKRSRAGVTSPDRPICSLLFLGPTGVGKTHLARTLGEQMFHENNFKQFDMSEYAERHTVSKMIGSPPGYVGFGEGGALTEYVRHNPHCVLLFDEIEKAHPEVLQLFLQLMEYGVLTDSEGLEVNFRNTVVIMTSNIGSHKFEKQHTVGFQQQQPVEQAVVAELKKQYAPEFINRIDEVVVFNKLSTQHMVKVADQLLRGVKRNIKRNTGKMVQFDRSLSTHLANKCDDMSMGARPLRRLVTELIETPLADQIISNRDVKKFMVHAQSDDIKIECQ